MKKCLEFTFDDHVDNLSPFEKIQLFRKRLMKERDSKVQKGGYKPDDIPILNRLKGQVESYMDANRHKFSKTAQL